MVVRVKLLLAVPTCHIRVWIGILATVLFELLANAPARQQEMAIVFDQSLIWSIRKEFLAVVGI